MNERRVASATLAEEPDTGPADNPAVESRFSRGGISSGPILGVRVGTLMAVADGGLTALVTFPGQPDRARLAARTVVDLHGSHIGGEVTLMFEDGDPARPIVVGCMKRSLPEEAPNSSLEVDVDGRRLLIAAKDEMVLRCGKASITLTRAGKIIIDGAYVSNRSSGVLKLKGGAVHIN